MLRISKLFIDGNEYGNTELTSTGSFLSTGKPFISWAAESDKENAQQTECEVGIYNGETCLWEKVIDDAVQKCEYDGNKLPQGVLLTLKLIVRDNNGETAECTAEFIDAEIDWKAPWIGTEDKQDGQVIYFEKSLSVKKEVQTAYLYHCGIGYCEFLIDDFSVTDKRLLDPAFVDYSKQCQYVFNDVTDFFFDGEEVKLQAIVAPGWRYNPKIAKHMKRQMSFAGDTMLTAMLHLNYMDGTDEWVYTDESWLAGRGSCTTASVFDGTKYDANIEDFTDMKPVVIKAAPGGIMRPMLIPYVGACEYLAPVAYWHKNGGIVIDFGKNIAGVLKLYDLGNTVKGQTISIRHSEELTEDGDLFTDTLRHAEANDIYVCCGDDVEFYPKYTYHGFRYARIDGAEDIDIMNSVRAVAIRTQLDTCSSFRCGNPLITAIHNACVATERANMHSILTDCPQRDERMGWMNDATVRFEETPYNFRIGTMFKKVIEDLIDIQDDTGAITCTAPYVFGGQPADPVCSSFLVAGYQLMIHCDDSASIRKYYSAFEAWENCLLLHSGNLSNDKVKNDGGAWELNDQGNADENDVDRYIVNYTYYGDWAAPLYACKNHADGGPGAVSIVTPGIFMSTGFSYYNCVLLTKMAKYIGLTEKADKYSALAVKIKNAILKKWYDPEKATFATASEACQAFALWLGIVPEGDEAKAAKVLRDDLVIRNYDFTTGNLCTRYMMDVLAKYGYIEDAYKLITKETCPSFGFMLQQEATTIWERFELMKDAGMNSHNHPMYGAVDYWMYAYLAGIKPTAPGWTEFEVRPYIPEKLQSVQAVVDTVKGNVAVRIVKRYEKTHMQLDVPFGCRAHVVFGNINTYVNSGFHTFML